MVGRRIVHYLVELAGVASIVAGAWLYDMRIGLILMGLALIKSATTGGLTLPREPTSQPATAPADEG